MVNSYRDNNTPEADGYKFAGGRMATALNAMVQLPYDLKVKLTHRFNGFATLCNLKCSRK
jgi:hypothetical protein